MNLSTLACHLKAVTTIAICLFSVQSIKAQLPEGYEQHYYKGMRYGLFKPVNYNAEGSYPLIIFLHGSTDTTSWDHGWYHDPIQTEDPCFVLTPKSEEDSSGWGSSWKDTHSENMKKTLEILDSLIDNYHVDINRLYINGTSMGGYGVFSVLAKEPGKFAAAYSICGGGTPEVADKLMQTPLWIFHGEMDDVVPVKYSRDIYEKILSLGGKEVRYTEYPGVKHNSWENAGKEKTLTKWMLLQEKGTEHGSPEPLETLTAASHTNGTIALNWNQPSGIANTDNDVWYYKLFRNNILIAEIDNNETSYIDSGIIKGESYDYNIVVVNYFFKESIPSKTVNVK
jgi:predicted esterase